MDDALKDVVDTGLTFGANSGDDTVTKLGSKVSFLGGGSKDDGEYELLKGILLEEQKNAEVSRAVLDGFTHYDRSYDIAVIALEGAAGMNEALEIKGQ